MKKRILFVIDSLSYGGAEKSLITLLRLMDYTRFEIDLQLFAYGGMLSRLLPGEVHVLPPLNHTCFLSLPIWKQLRHPLKFWARAMYSLKIRKSGLSHSEIACLYWQTVGKHLDCLTKPYDAAIAYAQGIPTFYVVEKVSAKRKYAWVNTDYRLDGKVKDFQRRFYDRCDRIITVSDYVKRVFSNEVYPEFAEKMKVLWDIIDAEFIRTMSRLPSDKIVDHSAPVLMTVGRLEQRQKGHDLILETSRILRDRGVRFRWYVVGDGGYRYEMEQYIAKNDLQDHLILLGATANPYSYMRQCDVYVQTSRREGFGLTIAEARILNRPIVCTNFNGCTMQIADGKNGLITSFEPTDIADAVERLLTDRKLYSDIQSYLQNEKNGNTEEIEKFYQLVEM